MVNLLPGPTRDAIKLAERAVSALERIARAVATPMPVPVPVPTGPNMNPEVGVHAQLDCRLTFTYGGPGPVTVWCNTHDVELPLILDPVVPPLDDADLAALRQKLED